ncbi:MAG: TlpA disulfide reductase family protein [Flavitalea sp.]
MLLINVWATWCGPCIVEFPELVKINRMYHARDFQFITISADTASQNDKVLAFLKGKHAANKNYLYTGDNSQQLFKAIDPKWLGTLPYTILVEPGGKIVYAKQNLIDPFTLKKNIVDNKLIGRVY